ncbi:hypothetical protein ABUW04_00220 [Streptacidiphilus sp. N1-10]|uniref:PH domain-containing protein n=1 Tax=Streptacidiphilus jeojiensis TaxID=3229225 RepID=A0ABV6XEI3_9ACTN
MTGFQMGLSRRARTEKLRRLAWQSGVVGGVALWGYFAFSPLGLAGLRGWGVVAVCAAAAVVNAVVSINRCLAVVWVEDEGMEMRSLFTHQYIRWDGVSDIAVERRGVDLSCVLRVYRIRGYPVTVPGWIAAEVDGLAEADLRDRAAVLRQQWHRVVRPVEKGAP